jgi:DUF1680 family protein
MESARLAVQKTKDNEKNRAREQIKMRMSRREILKNSACSCLALPLVNRCLGSALHAALTIPSLANRMTALPPNAIKLEGFLERYIQLSIRNWSKGIVPYEALVEFFRTGRPKIDWDGRQVELFATGEMWGKAVRSAALFYRYTGDFELKAILKKTVADLLSTRRENGTISCAPVNKQPDGPGGDLWERTYVLLALDDYYEWVERDPEVLRAMTDEADATIRQVGPTPKTRIVDLGWSPNHIESSTILEPMMRLYKRTGSPRYLEFARYIVETEGGAKHHDIFSEVLAGCDPVEVGGVYPKAYEMLSLFEGVVEYYRATGNERWLQAALVLFHKVIEQEITLIGNGGGDQPYHPNVMGEAWDNTALEQTNPNIKRMMETCTGVTWLKFCSQVLRLTSDPIAVDYIEQYAYNGLIGAMKPSGDGFSYVNLLNGVKTNPIGWGTTVEGVYVTCCNLNGPEGLAYLPLIAVMSDEQGPVVNLYNSGTATLTDGTAGGVSLTIETNYPLDGVVRISVAPAKPRRFVVKLRIPAWSLATTLKVNGETITAEPGSYARIERRWAVGDVIELALDMRCRVIRAKQGASPGSDRFRALMRGPVVLARDENIDSHFDQPVDILAADGFVAVKPVKPTKTSTTMQFEVPSRTGMIQMVDYASVNSWEGKKVQTWLPIATMRD